MKSISTERLTLRPYQESDLESLSSILRDSEVMNHVLTGNAFSNPEIDQFIAQYMIADAGDGLGFGTLCRNDDRRVIGCAGLILCHYLKTEEVEIGYILGQMGWGKGYATEIGIALTEYGLNEMNRQAVFASVQSNNIRSKRVLEKTGMVFLCEIKIPDRGIREIYKTIASKERETYVMY